MKQGRRASAVHTGRGSHDEPCCCMSFVWAGRRGRGKPNLMRTSMESVPATAVRTRMQLCMGGKANEAAAMYVRTYIHTYIHTHVLTYIHTYIQCIRPGSEESADRTGCDLASREPASNKQIHSDGISQGRVVLQPPRSISSLPGRSECEEVGETRTEKTPSGLIRGPRRTPSGWRSSRPRAAAERRRHGRR